jgi:hypothetical protein
VIRGSVVGVGVEVVLVPAPVAQLSLNGAHPVSEVAKNGTLLLPHVVHETVHISNGRIGEWVSAG